MTVTTPRTDTPERPAQIAPVASVTSPPDPSARRFAQLVLAAVLVGLAIRVAIGLTDDAASTDETAYLQSGMSLVAGDGFARHGRAELHFPPVVPAILGGLSRLFPDPHTATVVATVAAGTGVLVPLALLGRRLAGPTAGVLTAWVAAVAPGLATMPQIRGTGSETEYLLFVVSALWLAVSAADREGRAQRARLLASGALVGAAYLTRPEGLFVAFPLALAVAAAGWHRGSSGWSRTAAAARVACFVAPVLLCIVPYAVYLHGHTGQWQLTAKTQDASIEAWHAVARSDRQTRNSILYALDDSGLHLSAEYSSLPSLAREDPSGYLAIVRTNIERAGDMLLTPTLLPVPAWLLAAWGMWRHRRSRDVAVLVAVGALPVVTAFAFFVQHRYLLLTLALATVLVGAALGRAPTRVRRVGLAALLLTLGLHTVTTFRGDAAGWWHPVEQTDQRRAGEWLAEHTDPDDRIMARSMIVDFYSERTTVAIPAADLDDIIRFARHYGVQYLVADWYTVERLIPQLAPLWGEDEIPGLRLVHELRVEGRTSRIFALDPAPPPSDEQAPSLGFTGDGG